MESATQVDLAKAEVPAGQAVNSVLEEAADHLTVEPAPHPQDAAESRSPRRSTRGGSASTYQVRLKPKHSNRSPSPSPEKSPAGGLTTSNLEAVRLASELQPVDHGFGAWSYVASTFAMYIVVWGAFQLPPALPPGRCLLTSGAKRLSTGLSHLPDISIYRKSLEIPRFCCHPALGAWIAGY
jgi:hypothetical protein